MNTPIFTPQFTYSDPETIANQLLDGSGYAIFKEAISPDVLTKLLNNIEVDQFLVNNNTLGFVRANSVNFLSHTLAVSKECYDITTSEEVRAICRKFFGDCGFKLSNQRIFETHTKAHMPWHTDNNLQDGNTFKGKHNLPGILFLFYLSDVSDVNPFQLIPHSQTWSSENTGRFFTDKYIEQSHTNDITSVRGPKGTLVVCNTHLIHRAEPFDIPNFKRLAYLFQVDAISDEHVGHGEKLFINPSFIENTSPEILRYLGFGMQADYPTFPHTSVATLLPSDFLKLQKAILPHALRGLAKAAVKSIIPDSFLIVLKNLTSPKQEIKAQPEQQHHQHHHDHY